MIEERRAEEGLTGEVLAVTDQLLNESRALLDDLDTRLAGGAGKADPNEGPPEA